MTRGTLDESIDTLRELSHWVAEQQPVKRARLKGELRRDVRITRFGATRDWPYCECCGEFCQRAEGMLREEASAKLKRLSPRFCRAHSPTKNPSAHRATMRHKKVFKATLRAIYEEMRMDREFRRKMKNITAADTVPDYPDSSLNTDPIVSLARRYAFRIARESPSRTLLDVAQMRMDGLTQCAIAVRLGIKRSTVSMQIRNHADRGCFDFTRHSRLLYWWPDQRVVGEDGFKLETQRTPKRTCTGSNRRITVK